MMVDAFKGSIVLVGMVLERLSCILTMYECVTVADYYELIGKKSRYSDNKMGWLSLDDFRIVDTDEKSVYELIVPKALRLE